VFLIVNCVVNGCFASHVNAGSIVVRGNKLATPAAIVKKVATLAMVRARSRHRDGGFSAVTAVFRSARRAASSSRSRATLRLAAFPNGFPRRSRLKHKVTPYS